MIRQMACGTPAICTNVASMTESVREGVTGFIVRPNDPQSLGERILCLRDHPCQARTVGNVARKRILEQFAWGPVVHRCLDIYGS